MGQVFRRGDANHHDAWFQNEPGRSVADLEKYLLQQVWSPCARQRVLEVGCGSGFFLEWLASQGHMVTGLEPSESKLRAARKRLPSRVQLDRGYAEDLPYEDNAFDTVVLITTLQFVNDPVQALKEAFRVARSHVLLEACNRYSLVSVQRYWERLWQNTADKKARFFSVFELRNLVENALSGSVPIHWRTGLSLPLPLLPYLRFLEKSRLFTWHPFGHFIAMRIDLQYPLQTAQNPVFCKIPSRVREMPTCSSCWRLGRIERSVSLQPKVSSARSPEPSSSHKEMFI